MKRSYLTLSIPEDLAREWFRAVDAEIVIICKDCRYWTHNDLVVFEYNCCDLTETKCEEDHFCSWAERRDSV